MPSRADGAAAGGVSVSGAGALRDRVSERSSRLRAALEWLLRAIVVGLLLWYLWHTLRVDASDASDGTTSAELSDALSRWSTTAAPARVHVSLDHPPEVQERDWLAALRGAGTAVEWSGPSLLPTAAVLEPRADPAGGADLSVSVPDEAVVLLRDTLGVLDSARAGAGGLRAYLPRPRSTVDAVVGPVSARAALRDSLGFHRLLVIGAANWETKFVTAALEERGWRVDVHVVVSPKGDVRQGTIGTIDTIRYSAVLALDTTAARYADQIGRYVRQGGGLVLWSPAARSRGFTEIAPAAGLGEPLDDQGRPVNDTLPRLDLTLVPLTRVADEAVVLERRGDHVALAARRVGTGRVIETGYANSWRWRMAGGEDAPEAHREWLAGLVAQVAHVERVELDAPPVAPAPLASLIDRLGPASGDAPRGAPTDMSLVIGWIFAVLCASLLLEWASRRLRGVR